MSLTDWQNTESCAWHLHSRRLQRDLWLVKDTAALTALGADRNGLPVVFLADVEDLRPLDDVMLGAVLDALAIFPGARVTDVVSPNV